MIAILFGFELKARLRRLSTWVYFALFFTLSFLGILSTSGIFNNIEVGLAGSGGTIFCNAPHVIFFTISLLSCFGTIVIAALMGDAGSRDFQLRSHSLFFTCPIRPFEYLLGRYLGTSCVLLIIFSSLPLGALSATLMPVFDSGKLGPNSLAIYLWPMLLTVLPNILIFGGVFFSLAALSRKIVPVYVAGVLMLIGYMIAGQYSQNIEHELLASLFDPFVMQAYRFTTRYWTAVEKNSLLLPLEGMFLYNRLLWGGVGLLTAGVTVWTFRFRYALEHAPKNSRKQTSPSQRTALPGATLAIPDVSRQFSGSQGLRLAVRWAWVEFRRIVKSGTFFTLLLAGILYMFASAGQLAVMFGTSTYPLTGLVLELLGSVFTLFIVIIIAVYAGELVWGERDRKSDQCFDTLPLPAWLPYLAKLGALILVQVALLGCMLCCGVLIQAAQGYFNFEFGLYLKKLFAINLIDYVLLCVLTMFFQTVAPHKYVGHTLTIGFFLLLMLSGSIGLNHNLLKFTGDPGMIYSDMDGYADMWQGFVMFKLYWGAFAVILALLTYLFRKRGTEVGCAARIRTAQRRCTPPVRLVFGMAAFQFVLCGSYIFYNTNILNTYRTPFDAEERQAEYEKRYKQYETLPQPRITAITLKAELYPESGKVDVNGIYQLKNTHAEPIEAIHLRQNPEFTLKRLCVREDQCLTPGDSSIGYHVYTLPQPLEPGESLPLTFEIAYRKKGFRNSIEDYEVLLLKNGTFLDSMQLPHIGYSATLELEDDDVRKKHGLAPRAGMADVADLQARRNTYVANDGDWIRYEAVIGTHLDQTALTVGQLKRSWVEDGRRYFSYDMGSTKILPFFPILSARYDVRRTHWKDVPIEIYYHPGHQYNLDRMIQGVKLSLEYYSEHFGPYPFGVVRIAEFPRYRSFAQAFPGLIPYSEAIGFVAKVVEGDERDINYPLYVTAHEMAHQWWAHQLIGGNVQGSTLLSESLAQYSALMVMKQVYTPAQMKRFLKYELDKYLVGRSHEKRRELPLYRCEEQPYIYYHKGSVAMYALQDYVGEETLNRALATYLRDKGHQEPPYTNSLEFLDYLRREIPSDSHPLLTDLFERIVVFNNKAISSQAFLQEDGSYKVRLTVESHKLYADEFGAETDGRLDDPIDIGILGEHGEELYLKKHRLHETFTELTIRVPAKPKEAGIDVYNKLIDRDSDDNLIEVTIDG